MISQKKYTLTLIIEHGLLFFQDLVGNA